MIPKPPCLRHAAALLALTFLASIASPAFAAPIETQVEAHGPANVLRGTMLAPASGAKAPVVLIIPGSGPTDRDGNNPMGIRAATYRYLAQALADRGLTTVRIDKRGMFGSAAPGLDPNHITIADYAADVHAWAAELRRQTGAPCVWVLGHSEGGLVAAKAAQDPTDICGIILVSAAGRKLGDILREQLQANPANEPLLPIAMPAIDALEAGRHVDVTNMPAPLLPLFYPAVQDFLIDEMSYDPADLVAAYKGPVLVLQGGVDLQTSGADATALAFARPGVSMNMLDGVNHVLKAAPRDRAANLATYADPDLPLAPGVADPIVTFIEKHARAR